MNPGDLGHVMGAFFVVWFIPRVLHHILVWIYDEMEPVADEL